ncbi:DUF2752 domain-containing protein [Actinomadura terrae]|nr:DUF2752 domain-containing protein [Actinomadura terrae]
MIHALAHGDVREALGLNLFAVAMLPVLGTLDGGSRTGSALPGEGG